MNTGSDNFHNEKFESLWSYFSKIIFIVHIFNDFLHFSFRGSSFLNLVGFMLKLKFQNLCKNKAKKIKVQGNAFVWNSMIAAAPN